MTDLHTPAGRVAAFPGETAAFLDALAADEAAQPAEVLLERRLRAVREDASRAILALQAECATLRAELECARDENRSLERELAAVRRSKPVRAVSRLSAILAAARRLVFAPIP